MLIKNESSDIVIY